MILLLILSLICLIKLKIKTMIYKLYFRIRNIYNGNTQIESIANKDINVLRNIKESILNHTFGNVIIEQAMIMDQNMLYINDNE